MKCPQVLVFLASAHHRHRHESLTGDCQLSLRQLIAQLTTRHLARQTVLRLEGQELIPFEVPTHSAAQDVVEGASLLVQVTPGTEIETGNGIETETPELLQVFAVMRIVQNGLAEIESSAPATDQVRLTAKGLM